MKTKQVSSVWLGKYGDNGCLHPKRLAYRFALVTVTVLPPPLLPLFVVVVICAVGGSCIVKERSAVAEDGSADMIEDGTENKEKIEALGIKACFLCAYSRTFICFVFSSSSKRRTISVSALFHHLAHLCETQIDNCLISNGYFI
ncbi:hypothetical protein ACOME3_008713 [Neoechinorhynchus agilis]